jgi:hypothetical protein
MNENNNEIINKMYEVEHHIMETWHLVEDVKLLYEQVMENYLYRDQDKLANALLGLCIMYDMKFEKAFNAYEEALQTLFEIKKAKEDLEE